MKRRGEQGERGRASLGEERRERERQTDRHTHTQTDRDRETERVSSDT